MADQLESLLRQSWADPNITFLEHQVRPAGRGGIISALTAQRCSPTLGIWRHSIRFRRSLHLDENALDIVVKRKADDTILEKVADQIGGMVHPLLQGKGRHLLRGLGLLGGAKREVALYREEQLAQFRPATYGAEINPDRLGSVIAMECLTDDELPDRWTSRHINAAIHGIAEVHAIAYKNPSAFYLCQREPTDNDLDPTPLFGLLSLMADASRTKLSELLGEDCLALQTEILGSLPAWWELRRVLPMTVIHNDFQPRNIAFRNGDDGSLKLCAFDWELTTVAPPEHDIAELLCFALPNHAHRNDVCGYLELHRKVIEEFSGHFVALAESERSFAYALKYLFINRLSMYAMYLSIAPDSQLTNEELGAVFTNWQKLYSWFEMCE